MSVYALSDLHGELELWNKIKNFLTKDDVLVFLGDVIDRGKDGLKILIEMLEDDRVIFLKGNHEQNLINAYLDPDDLDFLRGWFNDGGLYTWEEFLSWSKNKQKELYLKLSNLPSYAIYVNCNKTRILLSHSGFTPDKNSEDEVLSERKAQMKYLYNRKHIEDMWPDELDNTLVVHGHTPTGTIDRFSSGEVLQYCNNHKIDIDTGATFCGIAALLDLDTLLPIYFYTDANLEDIY